MRFLLCFSVLVLCLSCVQDSQACTFPHFLTQRPRWESHISLNRRSTEVYWKFRERTLEIVDLTTNNGESEYHECYLELPNQKYVVHHHDYEHRHDTFFCVQFLLRSSQIIQLKKSEVVGNNMDVDELCADKSLTLDAWPLVWPEVGDTYHQCPLNGGYDFHMVDNHRKELLCNHASLKPRLESECMTGEGFSLDFRNFECRGRLEMEIKQTLACLGTWTDTGYSYTIMTDQDDLWPKLWLLRFPVRRGQEFVGHLFNTIVADPTLSISDKYFEMHFQQALYPSLCENEAYPCDDCESPKDFYCQKTCHRCDSLQDISSCEFDHNSQGEWTELSQHGPRDITVTTSMIYADDLLPLQCFDLHAEAWFEDKNYRALATVYKNGCKPRYTCVEFERLSTSVLLYRLSQNLIWPHSLVLTAQDVCKEAQFRDDPSPLQGELRSKHLKALVKKRTMNRPLPTVSCELSGKFLMAASFDNGLRNCTAYLDTCGSSHTFELKTEAECMGSVIQETYRCLGSYQDGNARLVITEKADSNGESYCWAFHKEEWDPTFRAYLLYASDCHSDIGRSIKHYGYKGHLAEFALSRGTGYLGSYPCHHDFSTSTTYTPSMGVETTRLHTLSSGGSGILSSPSHEEHSSMVHRTSGMYHPSTPSVSWGSISKTQPVSEIPSRASTEKSTAPSSSEAPSTSKSSSSEAPTTRKVTTSSPPDKTPPFQKSPEGPNKGIPINNARPVARASTSAAIKIELGSMVILWVLLATFFLSDL